MNASYPNKITFAWFDGIIRKGWKNPIKEEDLHDISPDLSCHRVMAQWSKYWGRQAEKKAVKANMSIIPTLIWTFGPAFILAGLNRLVVTLLQQVKLIKEKIAIIIHHASLVRSQCARATHKLCDLGGGVVEGLLLHDFAGGHKLAQNDFNVAIFLPIESSGPENEIRADIFPLQKGFNFGACVQERAFR